MSEKKLEQTTAAEAYLTLMADRGVDYLFANAGTDFAPLIEAMNRQMSRTATRFRFMIFSSSFSLLIFLDPGEALFLAVA